MPPLVGSEPFRSKGYLSGHAQPEFVVRHFKESQQFSDEDSDIGFVDQRIGQFQRTPSDGDIAISQTVKDNIAMTLYSVGVNRHDLVERVQGYISEDQDN